ncbi:MAG: hypothetical protein HY343_11390 [Lentisphaerae bacterium]|nr:hypothetical protein [Lentisphaerota bacterium]
MHTPTPSVPPAADRIRLDPNADSAYPKGFILHAYAPDLPDDVFRLCIAEWIGTRTEQLAQGSDVNTRWHEDEDGRWRLEWSAEGKCAMALTLAPSTDAIEFAIQVTNLGGRPWDDTFAFNCLACQYAPTFCDVEMRRTFAHIGRKGLCRLADTVRVTNTQRPLMQFYPMEGKAVPAYLRGDWIGCSSDVATRPFMAIVSKAGDRVAGMTADSALFLFNNADYSCMHVNNDAGRLEPGQSRTLRGRMCIMQGTLNDFLRRAAAPYAAMEAL